MAQTSVSRSPSYEQKARLVTYQSAMPEQRSRIQQVDSNMRNNKRDLKPGMSRLELMRDNYEKKLLKEKEQRLTEIRNQNKERLRSGGTVREFFAERRAMEASAKGKKNTSALPPIDLHFKQMKEQKQREISSRDGLYNNRAFQNHSSPQMMVSQHGKNVDVFSPQSHKTQHISQPKSTTGRYLPPKKRSTGVDKQNPLPPLHPGISNSHHPPTPNKRYETYANLENYDTPLHNGSTIKRKKHVPRTLHKQRPGTLITNRVTSNSSFYNEDDDDDDDESDFRQEESTPPNLSKVKALRNKRLSQQKLLVNTVSKENKLTDFEKWQIEQDNAKKQRLAKYKKEISSDSCDDDDDDNDDESDDDSITNDDLAKQEKELLELINAEKNKLQEIQKQREEIDEQERLEKQQEEQYFKYIDDTKKLASDTGLTEDEQELQKSFAVSSVKQKNSLQNKKSPQRVSHNPESSMKVVQGSSVKFYEQKALEASKIEDDVNYDLSPCSICGRKFATERLSKHEKVCDKFSRKKRKKFDTRKQRAQGQEHEQYVRDGKYKLEPEKKAKKKNWRAQHENFIATIRYAKGDSDAPPPPSENPDYEQCPYCERKFNAAAAERHIPRCKDIKSRTVTRDRTKKKR